MIIKNIATYLENLKQKDIKPEIFTVWPFPEGFTVLEILNSIGYKLAHLWDSVKINTTTETTDDNAAQVTVSGDVDQLNFDFKIPRGKDGEKGDPGVSVTVGNTTTLPAGESASVTNSGTNSDPVLNFGIPQGPAGEPGPENLVMITATASTTTQGDYTPDTTFTDALADIQANKVVCIKLENLPGRFYIPYSSSNLEILASAGTVSGSNQSIELYTIRWAADKNIISITGTKEGCIADGGQAGQVLAKKSNVSFDTEWVSNVLTLQIIDGVLKDAHNNIITPDFFNSNNYWAIIYHNKYIYQLYYIEKDHAYFTAYDYNDTNLIIKLIYVTKTGNVNISSRINFSLTVGGAKGQILAKKSASNGDCEWVDPPSGSMPDGGTTGQVLAKKSDKNGDVEWIKNSTIKIEWENTSFGETGSFNVNTTVTDNSAFIIYYSDTASNTSSADNLNSVIVTNNIANKIKLNTSNGYRTVTVGLTSTGTTFNFSTGFNTTTNTVDNTIILPLYIMTI